MKTEERFYLFLAQVSDGTLRELHDAMRRALEEDDALPDGKKKYAIREFADFRAECRAIERILKERGLPFEPVRW